MLEIRARGGLAGLAASRRGANRGHRRAPVAPRWAVLGSLGGDGFSGPQQRQATISDGGIPGADRAQLPDAGWLPRFRGFIEGVRDGNMPFETGAADGVQRHVAGDGQGFQAHNRVNHDNLARRVDRVGRGDFVTIQNDV